MEGTLPCYIKYKNMVGFIISLVTLYKKLQGVSPTNVQN